MQLQIRKFMKRDGFSQVHCEKQSNFLHLALLKFRNYVAAYWFSRGLLQQRSNVVLSVYQRVMLLHISLPEDCWSRGCDDMSVCMVTGQTGLEPSGGVALRLAAWADWDAALPLSTARNAGQALAGQMSGGVWWFFLLLPLHSTACIH